ncbi:MAG: bifunctional metallophosphatase/5'-nucleotidase [Bacteroidota bacterium]
MRTTLFAAGLLSLGVLYSCTPSTPSQKSTDFIILQLNDVYEITPLEGGKVGGLARVASLKHELEAEAPVITILAGDFLSPSLTGTLRYQGEKIAGKQMVETLNALGLDYVTFGNHEFDLKEPQLLARIDESEFTWISTNTFHVTDGDTLPFTQKGKSLPRSVVHSIPRESDTLQLALIGICLPFNDKPFVSYEGYNSTVQTELGKLAGTYDLAVAITHLNWAEDTAFARQNPTFPLILGGHDHNHMRIPVGDAAVTKADANAKTVYVHRVRQLADGTTSVRSELVAITDGLADDPAVLAVVNKWQDISNTAMQEMGYDPSEVLMTTDTVLDGRESIIRNEPAYLGTLTCEAMLLGDDSTDLAIFNSGSIRLDDQLVGTVTMYDVLRTYPYGGPITRTSIPGADLEEILRIGLQNNRGIGGYLQTVRVDSADGQYLINGQPIEPTKLYSLWMTDFMSEGNESGFGMLSQYIYTTPDRVAEGNARNDLRDAVAAYMKYLEAQK